MTEDEKLFPLDEQAPQQSVPEVAPKYVPPTMQSQKHEPSSEFQSFPSVPSQKAQQWGVVISIIIIVCMIIVGAFYAWGKRIAENQMLDTVSSEQ